MRIPQGKVSALMIKLLRNNLDDIPIATNMLGMTALTLYGRGVGHLAVKAAALLHINRDILVTTQAQTGLGYLVGAVMAIAALGFQLGMGITDLAGHQQCLEAGRRSDMS